MNKWTKQVYPEVEQKRVVKVFSAIETVEELLEYINISNSKDIQPTLTLDYATIVEMRVRLNMIFAYISALKAGN